MPLYEYYCDACGNNFDKICKAGTIDKDIACPKCGKHENRRKLSVFSFGTRNSSGDLKLSPASKGNCASCSSSNCSSCG
ncbi:MAG: zinc ribbon domain-containing protein [Candidatus Eremiobacteraeota bacterium]|nr:zinc ribbon domain-containing protein [Candidatus Eremiobacteraeota bacterium]